MNVRRFTVAGIVLPLLCLLGCREVSQPALDGTGSLFPVEQDDGWRSITRTGDLAIDPQFDQAFRFFEDRVLVRKNGAYEVINTSDTFAIPPTFAAAGPFSEGLAPIDRSGAMVITPQFAMTTRDLVPDSTEAPRHSQHTRPARFAIPEGPPSYISENLTRIRRNGDRDYLDRRGDVVISPQFSAAGDFRNGLARVRLRNGEMAHVPPSAMRVWPPPA